MTPREKIVAHGHVPLFRVLRAGHANPLDASHSRFRPGRWNTRGFAALYTCCSEFSARAVARDRLRLAAVEVNELQPAARPQLSELAWSGPVVDVASAEGIEAAGFAPGYPTGVEPTPRRSPGRRNGSAGGARESSAAGPRSPASASRTGRNRTSGGESSPSSSRPPRRRSRSAGHEPISIG